MVACPTECEWVPARVRPVCVRCQQLGDSLAAARQTTAVRRPLLRGPSAAPARIGDCALAPQPSWQPRTGVASADALRPPQRTGANPAALQPPICSAACIV